MKNIICMEGALHQTLESESVYKKSGSRDFEGNCHHSCMMGCACRNCRGHYSAQRDSTLSFFADW